MQMRTSLTMRVIGAALACIVAGSAHASNLIVNGGFEASDSGYTTPPGWTNIGAAEGIIPYSAVSGAGLVPYEGNNFYDIGGPATSGTSAIGWGISQSVATAVGDTYRLTFGLSDENGPGLQTILGVNVGGSVTPFTLTATDSGYFARQFATQTLDYVATSALTTISFTLAGTNETGSIGNNDPLLDGISFEKIASGAPGAVPEPASWAMMIGGFGMAGGVMRRQRRERSAASLA